MYDSIYRRTYFWREVCCTVSAGSTRTGARNIDTESVRCRVIKPHTSQPKPSQAIVWQHVPDDVLLGSDTPYGICYVHKQSEGLWLKPSRSINLNPHDTTRQIIITGGDQQQRRILFLLFYFIRFHITTYQRWHWSIRCHARSTSKNFHGIAYCCLHETSTVNLQTTWTLNGRDYQLFQYSENLISMIVINHSRYMHTVVSMKQIPSIYSKPELKGRDYPLFI